MTSQQRAVLIATIAGLATVCATAVLRAEPEPAKPEPSPLAGPRVTAKQEKPTLVQKDSEGKLVRLEERAESAAVPLLKLEGEAKAAVEKVLKEHAAVVAKALSEQQGLFLQIQSAHQSGDVRDAGKLTRQLREKAPALWEPSLMDLLTRAMPEEKAALLRSLVGEYNAALAAEPGPGAMGGKGASEPAVTPEMAARRVENTAVIREMARSLKTLTQMRREQTDKLLEGLGLTPEQDSKIRAMIHDTGSKAQNGQPTREAHQALIEEIKKLLTPEQQKQLMENLRKR